MLADTYGIGGRVVFKYLNAYGCLRWVWVGGLELSKRLRMLTVGVGVYLGKSVAYVIRGWPVNKLYMNL